MPGLPITDGVFATCAGTKCIELHGPGKRGHFTLRLIAPSKLVAVDISEKEVKYARRFGGWVFDSENYAKCYAYQLSTKPLIGSFVPLPRGGKMYVLPWTAQRDELDDEFKEKEFWDE